MCRFVRALVSLAIVRSNALLLQGTKDKEAYIFPILDLGGGVVMALLAPWSGFGTQMLGIRRLESQVSNRHMGQWEMEEGGNKWGRHG